MRLDRISQQATHVINQIDQHCKIFGENKVLDSIKKQMLFIKKACEDGVFPQKRLAEGQTFTYGILSSRELNSPPERAIKDEIDKVSDLLDTL